MVAWGLVTAVHWVYPFDRCPVRFRSWMEIVLVALVGVEASALLPVGQGDSFGRSLLVRRVALWSKEEFGGRTAAHLALHLDIVGLSVVIIWLVCLARASPIVSFPLYRLVQLLDRTGRMDEAMRLARQLVEKR